MDEISSERRWKDNPHPKAKTAFIISYPFQYYVYKNIYKHLDDAEFIVDLGVFFPTRQPPRLVAELVEFLASTGVYFRVLHYSDYFLAEYLREFFSKYVTLVGVWEWGCHKLSCNLDKRQVNLTYGAGKELTQVRFSRRYNDLILAYGNRDVQLFSLFTQAKAVGNPKFDDWFNDDVDTHAVARLSSQLTSGKKTILYLPTHSDLSSLEYLTDELRSIADTYNVIVKVHYFTVWEEPEKIQRLLDANIRIVKDDSDLLPLLKCSDVVLSDNSSAIFDAVLADKPLLVTDLLSEEYLDVQHKQQRQYRRGKSGALTYSGSIEQIIKKGGLVPTIHSASELRAGIEKALLDDDVRYRQSRKKIREELFAFNDGKCGLRAAEEIRRISLQPKPSERPILFHAIETYAANLNQTSLLFRNDRYRKVHEYEQLLVQKRRARSGKSGVSFSILVLDTEEASLVDTLRALMYQDFPPDMYEILVISKQSKATAVAELKRFGLSDDRIEQMRFWGTPDAKSLCAGIPSALDAARGDVICFTQSGYIVPSKWLAELLLAYELHPDTAGVGGYIMQSFETHMLLAEFSYVDVGRRLGIWKTPRYLLRAYTVRNRSFDQNPSGTLVNMSYKKDILRGYISFFEGTSIALAELVLKKHVIADHDLCFIPLAVTRIGRVTLGIFIKENFAQGMTWRDMYRMYPLDAIDYKVTFFSCLKATLLNLIDGNAHRRFSISLVIFLGFFFRWIGGLYREILRLIWAGEIALHYTRK